MSALVRRATVADARELVRMRQLALTCPEVPWSRPRDVPDGPWMEECRKAFASMLRDQDPETFAAFVVDAAPGRVAACAMGFLLPRLPGPGSDKPFNGDISTVATDPEFRRRGYARAVVTALRDWMDLRGCKRVTLASSSEGEPLYVSLGFVIDNPRMSWRPE
ncbi:GNAT family N-acetyltransferase [Streptomyces sp. NPDC091292]|uniref:GNAT family N-acetyltransferase n=1 Tax=Streptomyces sp. NPDC091292 TaxID=3365991 RepID=UPI003806749F